MKAGLNTVVKITYELRTEPGGDIVDSVDAETPLSFLYGHKNLLERFEKNLEGLVAGDSFKFEIAPDEGYGQHDPESFVELEKKMFEGENVPQDEFLFVGGRVPLQDQNGEHLEGKITAITDEHVTIDMNHPLAGKTLHFSGAILEVRDAHPTEIEHGHTHEGGQHHH